jgi:hypothetical protein
MATITDIDLLLRSEVTSPLSATLHDTRLTAIEDKINEIVAALNTTSLDTETYGEMYNNGTSASVNCAVANTHYTVPDFTAGHMDNVTMGVNGLVAPTAGDYQASAIMSFTGQTSHIYTFVFGVAGAAVQEHAVSRKIGTGSDIGACSVTGILSLAAGQTVTLMVADIGLTGVVTVSYATVVLRKIH